MRGCIVFLFFVFSASLVSADSYYADVDVYVDSGGVARFEGVSNHPGLAEGVSLEKVFIGSGYSLFNLSLGEDDLFTDFLFRVHLPEGSAINYVKTKGMFLIRGREGRLVVSVHGSDKPVQILVQYRQGEVDEDGGSVWAAPGFFGILALAVLGVFLVWRAGGKRPDVALTARQKKIYEHLKSSGKPVNQSEISGHLGIPKASVSRNLDTMEKKGVVVRERMGVSTMVRLSGK